jgi:hypothetical protein
MLWGVVTVNAPFDTGLVGIVANALAAGVAVRRARTALFRNERYRFTISRWALFVAGFAAVGAASALL